MAQVTVCIPAYRAERFLTHTLRSIAKQTYRDIGVEIAIEPPAAETAKACTPFLHDPRFRVSINDQRLGWAENIAALLARVRTPFFIILPHDDVLHPDYIETLLGAITARPDASVAYADMFCFGDGHFRKSLTIEEGGPFERLLSFFLGGAEAVPWRGVTRTTVLDGGATFPSNEFISFAVECEWACHLLRSGAAVRVPRPLYFKRLAVPNRVSTSGQWCFPEPRMKLVLEHHRRQMLRGVTVAQLSAPEERSLLLVCEAAMLRRYLDFSAGRFSFDFPQRARAEQLLNSIPGLPGSLQGPLRSRALLPLSRNAKLLQDHDRALSYAAKAVETDPYHWEALSHYGRSLLNAGRPEEAMDCIGRAGSIAPQGPVLEELTRQCTVAIEHKLRAR